MDFDDNTICVLDEIFDEIVEEIIEEDEVKTVQAEITIDRRIITVWISAINHHLFRVVRKEKKIMGADYPLLDRRTTIKKRRNKMALMPVDTRLKIERVIEDGTLTGGDIRGYLGISSIGDPCARKLWYSFRLCFIEKLTPRQIRLFARGHREEPIIKADLRKVGVICQVDENNQPEVVCGYGHIKGHVDDILENVPDAPKTLHLGEYKTANDKSFKDMVKNGLKRSKPVYYDQMVCYMKLLKLTRGLFIMVNKNDDARYYERISEDTKRADFLIQRGIDIISSEIPLPKMAGPDWFACKWCGAYEICHFGEKPIQTCRTCKYVAIVNDGKWECDLDGGKELTLPEQLLGCKHYKMFECLSLKV